MPVRDTIRATAEVDAAAPKELRDMTLALYAAGTELDTLIVEDQERYAMAQRKAGIDPRLLINGLEPVSALAREYVANVGVARLAAESGATVTETRERLARLPVEFATSSRRVLAATASRAEADRILIRLSPDGGAVEAALRVEATLEARGSDCVIGRASRQIIADWGGVQVRDLVATSGLSTSQFQRRFAAQVGMRPKLFARTTRFDRALSARRDRSNRSWTDIVHHLGYFDQAHFIRECHAFAGLPPGSLIGDWDNIFFPGG